MTGAEVLGYATGVAVILGAAAKWLISDYFKKAKELEEIKRRQTKAAILELQEVAKIHSSAITSHSIKLTENTTNLKYVQEQTKRNMEKFDMVMNHNEHIQRDMQSAIKEVVRSQVIELTKQLVMVRDKKNGK